MPELPPRRIATFDTPAALGNWLRAHHSCESELWVKIAKRKTGVPSVTWDEVVIECLCWGWIDGIKKSLDELGYLQRISPRRPRGLWSKRNREHALRLMAEGRMEEPGLAQVRAAQADGRWDDAYAVGEVRVPPDFLAALGARPGALERFEGLTKARRLVIALGLSTQRPETRQKRFDRFLEALVWGEGPKP